MVCAGDLPCPRSFRVPRTIPFSLPRSFRNSVISSATKSLTKSFSFRTLTTVLFHFPRAALLFSLLPSTPSNQIGTLVFGKMVLTGKDKWSQEMLSFPCEGAGGHSTRSKPCCASCACHNDRVVCPSSLATCRRGCALSRRWACVDTHGVSDTSSLALSTNIPARW